MSTLRVGAPITSIPGLDGRWSVWSQADSTGGYFLVPADDDARALGVKYAVVRAINAQAVVTGPVVELIRTDPVRPDLVAAAQRIAKERRTQRSTTR